MKYDVSIKTQIVRTNTGVPNQQQKIEFEKKSGLEKKDFHETLINVLQSLFRHQEQYKG